MTVRCLVVLLFGLGALRSTASAAETAGATDPAPAPNKPTSDQERAVCDGFPAAARLVETAAAGPRYRIDRSGGVAVPAAKRRSGSIPFFGDDAPPEADPFAFELVEGRDPIVRIEARRGGKLLEVVCGTVAKDRGYTVEDASTLRGADYVVLSVFDRPLPFEESAAVEREKTVATPEVAARKVEEVAALAKLKAAIAAYLSDPSSTGARKALDAALGTARDGLGELSGALKGAPAASPWTRLVKEAVQKATLQIDGAGRALPSAPGKKPDIEALRKVESALRAAPGPEEVKAFCESMAAVRWYETAGRWFVQRVELPLQAPPNLLSISYGQGAQSAPGLLGTGPIGVLVTDVPTGEPLSFAIQRRQLTSPAEMIAKAIGLVVGLKAASPSPLTDTGPSCKPDPQPKLGAEPIAPYGSRAFVVPAVGDEYLPTLAVCNGAGCASRKADDVVRNKVELEILPRARVTILTDFGATMPLGTTGTSGFGHPQFEPVGGRTGPDQLFQLRYAYDARQSIGAAVLLTVQRDRYFLGLGPSVWMGGSSASPLAQWHLRIGYLVAKGVAITTGPAVRVVQRAIDYDEGAVVSVPRPADGTDPVAPKARTKDGVAVGWSFGLAVDLAAIGDAGASLLKTLGVKG